MSVKSLSKVTDPADRSLRGMARRFAITITSRVLWQLSGVRNLDGSTEAVNSEVFPGIGFFARPPDKGTSPECVVLNIGGANSPTIVATRDEATRARVANLASDEAAMFNTLAIVHVTAGGAVDVRSAGGVAVPLATKADIDDLRTWLATHVHPGVSAGASSTAVPLTSPPSAAGTSVLKGE